MRQTHRYAARGLSALAVGALGVTLAIPATAGLAAEPPTPGPEWGVMQERPPLSQSQDPDAGPTVESPSLASGANASTLAAAATTPGWVLHGAGWGHGLGMSQYGAYEMARAGYSAQQILGHYYSGTTYSKVTDSDWVNVNVVYGASAVTTVSQALASGGGAFTVTLGGKVMSGKAGSEYAVSFSVSNSVVKASCSSCSPTSVTGTAQAPLAVIRWDDRADAGLPATKGDTLMKVGGTWYKDGAAIISAKSASTLNAVMQVRIHDEYLDYLAESPWSWSLEALKAQAAAARGYVLKKQPTLRSTCNCHVYDTTADQVYGGYPSSGNRTYWPNWQKAVRATGESTTGYVSKYGGSIISAFYSSSSGGRTEDNEDVWGGDPIGYLRGVSDSWSLKTSNPARAWRQVTSGSSMAGVFGLPDVARLDLSDRTTNGGVERATATSSSGATSTITGDQFRMVAASGSSFSSRVNSTMIRHLTQRLGGDNRYAVGAAVARTVAAGAGSVVIASGENSNLPDASVAGPLASTLNAPLLLTQRAKLPDETGAELSRRGSVVKTAYVVGGEAAVSSTVVDQLKSRGLTVVRVAGANRYTTAAEVAREIGRRRTVSAVMLAGGFGLADALAGSGPASALKEPILLTSADRLAPATSAAIADLGAKYVHIVGGTAVVGQGVEDELRKSTTVRRLGGDNRYEVSATIASYFRGQMPSTSEMVITSGQDASLVDSLVAGTRRSLMVLVAPTSLPDTATEAMQRTPALETVTAVGGTAVVSNSVLTKAARS